jgi:hypothetical protein
LRSIVQRNNDGEEDDEEDEDDSGSGNSNSSTSSRIKCRANFTLQHIHNFGQEIKNGGLSFFALLH